MDDAQVPIEAFVERYDETDSPVTTDGFAAALGVPREATEEWLQKLHECEFAAPERDGYRPTITAREYLALDIDAGPVIVADRSPDECRPNGG